MKESRDLGLPLEVLPYKELESGDDWPGRETDLKADCEEIARKGGIEP